MRLRLNAGEVILEIDGVQLGSQGNAMWRQHILNLEDPGRLWGDLDEEQLNEALKLSNRSVKCRRLLEDMQFCTSKTLSSVVGIWQSLCRRCPGQSRSC